MSASEPVTGQAWEDGGVTLMRRITGNAGTAITQASLSTITCKVFDLDAADPTAPVASPTVTIASSVFDTLQTSDPRWTEDATGFNFAYAAADSILATGGHRYSFEFKFTPASGAVFWAVFIVHARGVSTS